MQSSKLDSEQGPAVAHQSSRRTAVAAPEIQAITAFSEQPAKALLRSKQLLGSLWGKRLNKHTGGWGFLECT